MPENRTVEELRAENRRPVYVVLFSTADELKPVPPIVGPEEAAGDDVSEPHGLSFDVAEALPALWYTLHLPVSALDVWNPPTVTQVREIVNQRQSHRIMLAPAPWFSPERWPSLPADHIPTLVICPDDEYESASRVASDLGFLLGVTRYSELTNGQLERHWLKLSEWWQANTDFDFPVLRSHVRLQSEPPSARLDLPSKKLARFLEANAGDEFGDDVLDVLEARVMTNFLMDAESQGVSAEDEDTLTRLQEEARHDLRIPLTVAFPGVAPSYWRRVRTMRKSLGMSNERAADYKSRSVSVEDSAIAFIAEHHAIANLDPAIVLPEVPANAFRILADLERHWIQAARPAVVEKFLHRLNKACHSIWTEEFKIAVSRANQLHVFSGFPIGLLRFPGDTSPLSCRVPIAYRPIMPLTRALQAELGGEYGFDLSGGFRLLVAECVPESDPVRQISRRAWRSAMGMFDDHPNITAEYVEVDTPEQLVSSIRDTAPDILVISAHGFSQPEGNVAGLVIGRERVLGHELGDMPPFVVLSACHSGPRGDGVVTIGDMMLYAGATAVLATQVPVDVRHNSVLAARLFVYLAEVLRGNEDYESLLDVWHHVQSSNAVNEILMGNPRLYNWATASDPPVLTEFMLERSTGRIRRSHVYSDSESVLLEIAGEGGMGEKVANWMRHPGYVPESAFYMMLGRPHQIILKGEGATTRQRGTNK